MAVPMLMRLSMQSVLRNSPCVTTLFRRSGTPSATVACAAKKEPSLRVSQNAGILGIGMAVPEKVLTNADLERLVDTTDDWIVSRTGIRERRMCRPEETSSSLGAE